MCGIVGCWANPSGKLDLHEAAGLVRQATQDLAHRGPDDQGIWQDLEQGVVLGHRRLSILDLSLTGHQPMVDQDGNAVLIFNGEIYNYVELRRELEAYGCRFRGTSDTEVLLKGYIREGYGFIRRLRGMFAFAIWDTVHTKLILARDRVGKKPLYYALTPDGLFFASEIRPLGRILPVDRLDLDLEALNVYLSYGSIVGEHTIYRGIRELPPGSWAQFTSPTSPEIQPYWRLDWQKRVQLEYPEALEHTEELVREAVNLRLRSDVPVGVFLSGGIDSGLVTALAATQYERPLMTFSIGFEDDAFDERLLARQVAERYDTQHLEVVLRPKVAESLPAIARAYGEPFADPSAVPCFHISQTATQYTKVVLNGDGGDELFCGYRHHFAARLLGRLQRWISPPLLSRLSKAGLGLIPGQQSHRSLLAFAHRFLRLTAVRGQERLQIMTADGFNRREKKELLRQPLTSDEHLDLGLSFLEDMDPADDLAQIIRVDFESGLPDILLVKMDIASMAHGLETRSPLLDQELAEFVFSLPTEFRINGRTTKPLLRTIAAKYLPPEVAAAPKRGFELPLHRWLETDLAEMRDDLLLDSQGIMADYFQRSYLESLLRGEECGHLPPGRWASLVWTLLMLALWDHYARVGKV